MAPALSSLLGRRSSAVAAPSTGARSGRRLSAPRSSGPFSHVHLPHTRHVERCGLPCSASGSGTAKGSAFSINVVLELRSEHGSPPGGRWATPCAARADLVGHPSSCSMRNLTMGPGIAIVRAMIALLPRVTLPSTAGGVKVCEANGNGRRSISVALPNKEMQLTKRGFLVGAPARFVRRRPAIFIESRFAADLRCWADGG